MGVRVCGVLESGLLAGTHDFGPEPVAQGCGCKVEFDTGSVLIRIERCGSIARSPESLAGLRRLDSKRAQDPSRHSQQSTSECGDFKFEISNLRFEIQFSLMRLGVGNTFPQRVGTCEGPVHELAQRECLSLPLHQLLEHHECVDIPGVGPRGILCRNRSVTKEFVIDPWQNPAESY